MPTEHKFVVTVQVEADPGSEGERKVAKAIADGLIDLLAHDIVKDNDGHGYQILGYGVEPYVPVSSQ